MKNVFLEVINSVNLVNKKMNDNMKSLFSKYVKLLAVILLSTMGVTQAWGVTIYETDILSSPASPATQTSNKGAFDGSADWGSPYTHNFGTSGSAGYYKLNFATPLDLSDYTDVSLTVYWGATSNRPLKVGFNGGSDTQIDAVSSSSDRSKLREASTSISASSLSSINLISSGGSGVYFFHVVITGTATGSSCTTPTVTFSNGSYTIGGSALNLSSLFTSNGTGAVTYTVTNAGGTGATIAGSNFTATAAGSATVKASQVADATYCAAEETATITVSAAACTPISPTLSYTSTSLTVGGGNSATPTISGNAGSGTVTYTSSNTGVATVNSSTGVVTPVAAGNATITASIAANGGYCAGTATANFTVSAAACTPITPTLSYTSTSLTVGGGNSATPTISGNTGSGTVTYTSSNTGVATVNSSTGVVTPVAAGSATITATIAAKNGYCAGTATANFTISAAAPTTCYTSQSYSSGSSMPGGWSLVSTSNPKPQIKNSTIALAYSSSYSYSSGAPTRGMYFEADQDATITITSSKCQSRQFCLVEKNGSSYSIIQTWNADNQTLSADIVKGRTYYITPKASSSTDANCNIKTISFDCTPACTSHTVTAASNNNSWGTATAAESPVCEGETTTITATPASGYKFVGWAVSGTGSTLSSTSTNPTTLTMGTANTTVTATFAAAATYTITYNKGANGSGTIASGVKTEGLDFTLSSEKFTRSGYVQTGWSTTDGGEKVYELGGTYSTDANITLYPVWSPVYTITFDANGGSGTMAQQTGSGTVKLNANMYTYSGYTFLGWSTSNSATTATYLDKANYNLTANVTLYAVWEETALPSTVCAQFTTNSSFSEYDFGDYVLYFSSSNTGYVSLTRSGSTSNICNGAAARYYSNGVVIYLKNTGASRIVLQGQQDNTLEPVNVKVADALDGTYNALSGTAVNYTTAKSCGELGISNVSVAKGKYVFIGFSGSKNELRISGLCIDPIYCTPPTINSQPESQTIEYGATPTALSVTATASNGGTLSYQWYKGTMTIAGATSATLAAANIDNTATATYYCVVTETKDGETCTAKSNKATVSIRDAEIEASIGGVTYEHNSTYNLPSQSANPSTAANVTVTIHNVGLSALNISSVTASGDFTVGTISSSSIAAGGSATVDVSIAGGKAPGTYTGYITVNSNDRDESAYKINFRLKTGVYDCTNYYNVVFSSGEAFNCGTSVDATTTTTGATFDLNKSASGVSGGIGSNKIIITSGGSFSITTNKDIAEIRFAGNLEGGGHIEYSFDGTNYVQSPSYAGSSSAKSGDKYYVIPNTNVDGAKTIYIRYSDGTSYIRNMVFKLQEPKLSAPTGLTATASVEGGTITWNSVSGATKYIVSDGTNNYETTATSYDLSSITTTKTITVVASIYECIGEEASVAITPLPLVCPPMTAATNVGATTMTVNWTAPASLPSGTYNYRVVWYNTSDVEVGNSGDLSSSTMSYNVTGLTANTTYKYKVFIKTAATPAGVACTANTQKTAEAITVTVKVTDCNGIVQSASGCGISYGGQTYTHGQTFQIGKSIAETLNAYITSSYGFSAWKDASGNKVSTPALTVNSGTNVTITLLISGTSCTTWNQSDMSSSNLPQLTNDGWTISNTSYVQKSNSAFMINYNGGTLTSPESSQNYTSISIKGLYVKKKEGMIFKVEAYDNNHNLIGTPLDITPTVTATNYSATFPGGTSYFKIIGLKGSASGSSDYSMYFPEFTYCSTSCVSDEEPPIFTMMPNSCTEGEKALLADGITITSSEPLYKKNTTNGEVTALSDAEWMSIVKIYKYDEGVASYVDQTSALGLSKTSRGEGTESGTDKLSISHSTEFEYGLQYKIVVPATMTISSVTYAVCDAAGNGLEVDAEQVFCTRQAPRPTIKVTDNNSGAVYDDDENCSMGTLLRLTTVSKTFKIVNNGTDELDISSIGITGAGYSITSITRNGSSVTPSVGSPARLLNNGTDNVLVTVKWTGTTAGTHNGVLNVASNATNIASEDAPYNLNLKVLKGEFVLPYTYESGCTDPILTESELRHDYGSLDDIPEQFTIGGEAPKLGENFYPEYMVFTSEGNCMPSGNSALRVGAKNGKENASSTAADKDWSLKFQYNGTIGNVTVRWSANGYRKFKISDESGNVYYKSPRYMKGGVCYENTVTVNNCTEGATSTTLYIEFIGVEPHMTTTLYYLNITPCDPEMKSSACDILDITSSDANNARIYDDVIFMDATSGCSGGTYTGTTFTATSIGLSPNATVSPAAGAVVPVTTTTNVAGETVKYYEFTVTAENGTSKKTYQVYLDCPPTSSAACYMDTVQYTVNMNKEDQMAEVMEISNGRGVGSCTLPVEDGSGGYTIYFLTKEDVPIGGYEIEGPTMVCVGSIATYRLANKPNSNKPKYLWEIEQPNPVNFEMVGDGVTFVERGGHRYAQYTGAELKLKAPNQIDHDAHVSVAITIDLDFDDDACAQLKGSATAYIRATDMTPTNISTVEADCVGSNGLLVVKALKPTSDPRPESEGQVIDATKYSWEVSPSTITIANQSENEVTLNLGKTSPNVDVTVSVSNGCGVTENPTTLAVDYASTKTTWTGTTSTDWFNRENWTAQVPKACTDVVIQAMGAGATNYPVIEETAEKDAVCDEIVFRPEAGVKGLEQLTYRRAYVQAALNRNKWYTITVPLKDMYSGDYYFNGAPKAYMSKYDAANPDNNVSFTAKWTLPFVKLNEPLEPGDGFAYQISNVSVGGAASSSDLKEVTWPRMTSDSALITSVFFYNQITGSLITSLPNTMSKTGENPYRFAMENSSGVMSTITKSVTAGSANLVANPMMSHLDLAKFFAGNPGAGSTVRYAGGGLASQATTAVEAIGGGEYTVVGASASATSVLPPMQAFFLVPSSGTSVKFEPSYFVEGTTTQVLRSVGETNGELYVTAKKGSDESCLSIRFKENASNGYSDVYEDYEKMFNDNADHEMYCQIGNKKVDVNRFGMLPYEAPIGVTTKAEKDTVELRFNGAESFEGINVTLENRTTGESIDLKENATYTYVYGKTTGSDAIYVKFAKDEAIATGVEEADGANNNAIQIYVKDNNVIRVVASETDPLKSVSVFDGAGRLVSKEFTNKAIFEKVMNGGGNRSYLVTAVTEYGVKSEMVLIK